jgi:UDP-2-acetamido-3-amino-2,3-dideoxy-glucuronate N-acetyltransferase
VKPHPTISDGPRIHPTAIIEPGVQIGARTAVWDNVHIRGPSHIGHDGIIGEKTYVAYGVTVGDFVKINAYVYVCTGVTIEDRVMVSAGVIFTNDRYPRAFSDSEDGLAFSGPTEDTLHTAVQEGATLGAGALIGPGIVIGRYAMVGMGAVVVSDVPAHGLVYGNPARLRGHVCVCGVPLRGLSEAVRTGHPESCTRCRRTYTMSEDSSGLQLFFEERRRLKQRG